MAVNLSALGGAGWQFFDSNGSPLSGGKLYTYAAGTTTPAATYTSSSGATPHANPIILDSAGRVASEIWLDEATDYKFALTTSADAPVWTKDDIYGIAGASSGLIYNEGDAGAVNRTVEARLQDYVSVKDFGAVGDDSTDDTAAFAAAAATGKCVIIPEGTYRVGGVLFNDRVIFSGNAKIRRISGSLAFAGGIEAPVEQIFLGAVGISQVDVNKDLTPEGWVDWFGYDADAIETCLAIFAVVRLGPRDYFTDRTVILDQNYREVIGSAGSAEGLDGTRIVLTGSAVATDPVVQLGTLNTSTVSACARRLNVRYINTIRDGVVTPPVSGRREDAVPGWEIAGWYESRLEDCFDYNSGTAYKVYGTVGCTIARCGCVRPNPGTVTGDPDFFTAFVVGGYSASFGFIGANASITITDCGCAGAVNTGAARVGVYLYGYIGDSWIEKFENSQMEHGVYVDGADSGGTTVTSLVAHRDVRVNNCVLDNLTDAGITIRNINDGGSIQVNGNYVAIGDAGKGIDIEDSTGEISIINGDLVGADNLASFGLWFINSKRIYCDGVIVSNFYRGLQLDHITTSYLRPVLTRHSNPSSAAEAVYANDVNRCYIAPIVDGIANSWTLGVNCTASVGYSEVNLTTVNPGSMVGASATSKLWYNGATVTTATFGTTNLRSGVVS